jgi:N-formylglutamate amidohydrolase
MNYLKKYITYYQGTIPIILSVPHGGSLEITDIPKRAKGVLGIDKNTIELAEELIHSLEVVFSTSVKNNSPSYIISKVHRNKIDMNREESEAYDSNSLLAKQIYRFYHSKIQEFIAFNQYNFNCSLLIDIHGFEKRKRPQGFRDVDIVLGTNNLASIKAKFMPKKERSENLRGKLIKKFIDSQVSIAPGHPRRNEYMLTGGYITQIYGSSAILGSQAMQIEFSDQIRIYDQMLRNKVLVILSEILFHEFG